MESLKEGRILRSHGSYYYVQTDDGLIPCRLRGKFRLNEENVTNPVVVGDRVQISVWREEGTIEKIEPRRNQLSRLDPRSSTIEIEHVLIANVDQVVLIIAAKKPTLKIHLIDRFLMAAERQDLPAAICINKVDLVKPNSLDDLARMYEKIGYPVYLTSAKTGQSVAELASSLHDKLSVFTGQSGVGKSSLLNAIENNLGIRVGKVSDKNEKGRHTTSHTELIPLSQGGLVADTPGFRNFGLLTIQPEDVETLFLEFHDYLGACQFNDCRHLAEPGCAVKAALEAGHIFQSRYDSYQRIMQEMLDKPQY